MKGSFLLVLLLLVIYTVTDFVFQDYNTDIIYKIENISATFFVYDEDFHSHLKDCLSKETIVGSITSEKNIEIMKKMERDYKLQGIEGVVDSSLLPHLIRIEFSGKEINREKYLHFTEIYDSLTRDKGAIFNPEESYFALFSKVERLSLLELYSKIAIGLLLFLLVLIIEQNYIVKTDIFWKAYAKAGGCKPRYSGYIQAFLLSVLLPSTLFVILLYSISKKLKINYSFDIRVWIIMIGVMILASQIAWLVYREDDL